VVKGEKVDNNWRIWHLVHGLGIFVVVVVVVVVVAAAGIVIASDEIW
jgi:hypothetical protein